MAEEQDDGHAVEVLAHPGEQQVGPYVLDQAPPREKFLVEAIRPEVPELAGEHGPRRREVLLAPVFRPQVLPAPEVSEYPYLSRVKGLEDETLRVAVVDDLRDPRRPAPATPGQEDGASVVASVQVHVEPAEQPPERRPNRSPVAGLPSHAEDGYVCSASAAGFSETAVSETAVSGTAVSGTFQSSLRANLRVMAARKKKISVEPGMYQCHSRKEDTR